MERSLLELERHGEMFTSPLSDNLGLGVCGAASQPRGGKVPAPPRAYWGPSESQTPAMLPQLSPTPTVGLGSNIKGQTLRASSQILSTPPCRVSKTHHHQAPWPSWFQFSVLQTAPSSAGPRCEAGGPGTHSSNRTCPAMWTSRGHAFVSPHTQFVTQTSTYSHIGKIWAPSDIQTPKQAASCTQNPCTIRIVLKRKWMNLQTHNNRHT